MSSKKQPNSFIFAAIMCLVCSSLLTMAAVGLKDRQQLNIKLDKQKNILKVLGLTKADQEYTREDYSTLYTTKVKEVWMDPKGQLKEEASEGTLPLYIVGSTKSIESYAVPFKAYGLWSWVYGYLALKSDGETVVGITVYNHGETPGLGGEVEKDWYQNQYVGKKIVNKENQFVSIGVVKGKVSEKIAMAKRQNYVDGISGATITSKGMETYIYDELKKYEPFSKRLRRR